MTQGMAVAVARGALTDSWGDAIELSMYHTPAAGTRYYRVTTRGTRHSGVLTGMGSYYTLGGRYHRPHQRTVYASDDALVSITEMAYYQALEWQERIGGGHAGTPIRLRRPAPPTYPLVSSHLLWCFTLTTPPLVIEVDDPIAYATFQHAPIEILNPGQAYETTQSLADRVRSFTHTQHARAEGIRAPSVRTPISGGQQPSQYALFVMKGWNLSGQVLWRADLTFEFLDETGNPASSATRNVDWAHPKFQLHGLPAAIPAFVGRPGAQAYHPGVRYPAEIRSL
jgi:RES domain